MLDGEILEEAGIIFAQIDLDVVLHRVQQFIKRVGIVARDRVARRS